MGSEPRPALKPLLLDARAAAECLGITDLQFKNLARRCDLPRPFRLAGTMRWSRAELELWRARECPTRRDWETTRDGRWSAYPGFLGRPFPPENDARGIGPPWMFERPPFGRVRRPKA